MSCVIELLVQNAKGGADFFVTLERGVENISVWKGGKFFREYISICRPTPGDK